jgi:hypothetical protein
MFGYLCGEKADEGQINPYLVLFLIPRPFLFLL